MLMCMRARATLVLTGLLLRSLLVLAEDVRQPYELTVIRDAGTLKCMHVALRETQLFRALPDNGYTTTELLETGQDRLHFIARDKESVWARAEDLCGDKYTWDFHTLVHNNILPPSQFESDAGKDQAVFKVYQTQEDPIPLEVEPLITSGDSENRVDLVFFADGCRPPFLY